MKLHLGCGDRHIDGYINIDHRYQPGVDRVDNVKMLRRFQPNSVDVIYSCAVLEHFSRWENKDVLKRWCEILKPGGILRISVPGWEELISHYLEHKDLRIIMGMLYGGQDYPSNEHRYIWDFQTLSEDLISAGFQKVYKYDWRKTEHAHIDDFSQSYLPHMVKDESKGGKLMHLNVEAIK